MIKCKNAMKLCFVVCARKGKSFVVNNLCLISRSEKNENTLKDTYGNFFSFGANLYIFMDFYNQLYSSVCTDLPL